MNRTLLVAAGSALVVGVVFAGRHRMDKPPAGHVPLAVHHQYLPLTPAQKGAAAQLFKVKFPPTNGTPPTYTLTAQVPFVAGPNLSLSAGGNWDTVPFVNNIILAMPNQSSYAQVYIGTPSATASQIVTFNISVGTGTPETFTLIGFELNGNSLTSNPISPTVTLSQGSYAVPVMLPPGYNFAEIAFGNSSSAMIFLDSATVQQY